MTIRRSIDHLFGSRFGRWTIIREVPPPPGTKYDRYVECRCACGTVASVHLGNLKSGMSGSCGCLKAERTRERSVTHGESASSEYRAWTAMKTRCYNTKVPSYADYGARGITVCGRWRGSFAAFLADVGPRPGPAHSLDRTDNDGNYEPGNVTWATRKQQTNNSRRNHRITVNGITRTMSEWADLFGLPAHVLMKRLRRGWSLGRSLTEPVR